MCQCGGKTVFHSTSRFLLESFLCPAYAVHAKRRFLAMKTKIRLWDALMLAIMLFIGMSWMWMVINGVYLVDFEF
jgi:hypothetical protein